ncbi:DsbA family protein [Streptomyces sp. NPDC059349]|uniref:DsbA family oxidoreductase n=1 Tax=Streptomyces sp. NPDC059349 TaxID=3346808 RepID=UPI00368D5B5B
MFAGALSAVCARRVHPPHPPPPPPPPPQPGRRRPLPTGLVGGSLLRALPQAAAPVLGDRRQGLLDVHAVGCSACWPRRLSTRRPLGGLYTPRVLRAFFQENRDIGQVGVLREIAEELGLDGADFTAALKQGTYTQTHQDALREAQAHRITVVPTLIIDGHTRIEGVPAPARIREAVLDAAAAQTNEDPEQGLTCGIDGC